MHQSQYLILTGRVQLLPQMLSSKNLVLVAMQAAKEPRLPVFPEILREKGSKFVRLWPNFPIRLGFLSYILGCSQLDNYGEVYNTTLPS